MTTSFSKHDQEVLDAIAAQRYGIRKAKPGNQWGPRDESELPARWNKFIQPAVKNYPWLADLNDARTKAFMGDASDDSSPYSKVMFRPNSQEEADAISWEGDEFGEEPYYGPSYNTRNWTDGAFHNHLKRAANVGNIGNGGVKPMPGTSNPMEEAKKKGLLSSTKTQASAPTKQPKQGGFLSRLRSKKTESSKKSASDPFLEALMYQRYGIRKAATDMDLQVYPDEYSLYGRSWEGALTDRHKQILNHPGWAGSPMESMFQRHAGGNPIDNIDYWDGQGYINEDGSFKDPYNAGLSAMNVYSAHPDKNELLGWSNGYTSKYGSTKGAGSPSKEDHKYFGRFQDEGLTPSEASSTDEHKYFGRFQNTTPKKASASDPFLEALMYQRYGIKKSEEEWMADAVRRGQDSADSKKDWDFLDWISWNGQKYGIPEDVATQMVKDYTDHSTGYEEYDENGNKIISDGDDFVDAMEEPMATGDPMPKPGSRTGKIISTEQVPRVIGEKAKIGPNGERQVVGRTYGVVHGEGKDPEYARWDGIQQIRDRMDETGAPGGHGKFADARWNYIEQKTSDAKGKGAADAKAAAEKYKSGQASSKKDKGSSDE